jgi:integrase
MGASASEKKIGKWIGTLDIGYINGKRKRIYVYGKTRKEASDKLREQKQAHEQGIDLTAEKQTVAQYLAHWLETGAMTWKPATHESYSFVCRVYINPHLGHIQLQKLTAAQVQKWVNILRRQEKVNGTDDENLSNRTIEYAAKVLSRAINKAVKQKILAHNAAKHVDLPRVQKHNINPLTVEQAHTLLAAVKGHRLEGVYWTALSLGMRQGEILALKWSDVDLDKRLLWVRESKTDAGVRTLSLTSDLVGILRAHKIGQAKERLACGSEWQDNGLVFPSQVGTPINKRNLQRHFKDLLRKADLPDVRFHDLRHTCATLLISRGVSLHVVKEILGHSKISITSDIYGHILPEVREEVSGIIGEILRIG